MTVALVACGLALRSFPERPSPICPVDGAQDPAYTAHLEPLVQAGVHDYVVAVSHAEDAVTNVALCLRADMTGMPEMAVSGWARPDRQQVRLNFEMGGHWQGTVMVLRPEGAPVAVPLSLDVG